MNTSYLELRKLIFEKKQDITDKELFTSKAYQNYLERMAESMTERYQRKIKVKNEWNMGIDAELASIDNSKITLNCCNYISTTFQERSKRNESLIGILAHEVAHVLFSDFSLLNLCNERICSGWLYPEVSLQSHANYKEISYLLQKKNKDFNKAVAQIINTIQNIIEDVYIELMICRTYPGLAQYILINRQIMLRTFIPIEREVQEHHTSYSIMHNLLLYYAFTKKINSSGEYKGIYTQLLQECIPIIDKAVITCDSMKRFQAAIEIFIVIWSCIKDTLPEQNQQRKKSKGQDDVDGQKQDNSSGESQEKSSLSAKEIIANVISNSKDRKNKRGNTQIPKGIGKPIEQKIKEEELVGEQDRIQKVLQKQKEDINECNSTSTDNILNSILEKIAQEQVYSVKEKELLEVLQKDCKHTDISGHYPNLEIKLNRVLQVSDILKENYKQSKNQFELFAKQLERKVKPILEEKQESGRLNGYYSGSHINMRTVYRNNNQYFYRNKLPQETSLAVALLVDESGSMNGKRIAAAQQTSHILYEFCSRMKIPIFVAGHSYITKVEISIYAEYNSIDCMDKYRIMNMSSKNAGNHDGAAIRYVIKRLKEREEETKLFFLISDGLPSAYPGGQQEGEADLHKLWKEYTNQGILFFAAAIGSDKDRINRIYGDGFLDITDLSKLPMYLVNLLTKYLI